MFVMSVRSSKLKTLAITFAAIIAVVAIGIAAGSGGTPPVADDDGVNVRASTAAERLAFFSQFGWEVSEDPVEIAEVMIPAEFDRAYEQYNDMQKDQGFDLSNYAGMRVKRWTYEVKNYPGYETESEKIQANLLVYDGLVIGGDICSLELNGFMKGFYPDAAVTTTGAVTTAAAVTTTGAVTTTDAETPYEAQQTVTAQ